MVCAGRFRDRPHIMTRQTPAGRTEVSGRAVRSPFLSKPPSLPLSNICFFRFIAAATIVAFASISAQAQAGKVEVLWLGKVDLLLVTHGHWDHIADAPALAKLNAIRMYAPGDRQGRDASGR